VRIVFYIKRTWQCFSISWPSATMSQEIISLCCSTRNIGSGKVVRTSYDSGFVRSLVLLSEVWILITSTLSCFNIGKSNAICFRMFPINITLIGKIIKTARIREICLTW
jgi:hypothetical protein